MKKSTWLIGCLGLGLVLFFINNPYSNQIIFTQCTNREVLAEQLSVRNFIADIDYGQVISVFLSIVGFSCIVIAYVLFRIRRHILHQNGCSTGIDGYFIPFLDARMLREIVKTEESEKLRTFYKWINILIPALYFGGIYVLIIAASF